MAETKDMKPSEAELLLQELIMYPALASGKTYSSIAKQAFTEALQRRQQPASVPAWVPVSERLPKDGKTVIFWIGPAEYASVGKLDTDSRCFHSVGGWVNQHDVTHWMPLPEPPHD